MKLLTGQPLADAYAATYKYLGEVHGVYEGGGWIVIQGNNLPPHPSLQHLYPNGWSLYNRVRSSEARKRIHDMTR